MASYETVFAYLEAVEWWRDVKETRRFLEGAEVLEAEWREIKGDPVPQGQLPLFE